MESKNLMGRLSREGLKWDNILQYVVVNYRWVFVIPILLPLSVAYDFFFHLRNYVVFKFFSAPAAHQKKVQGVRRQVLKWIADGKENKMCTARPGWLTMGFRRPKYKDTMTRIHVNLVDVVEVDVKQRTVKVEPLVTMGQLTATLNRIGWTIPVVPELDDLTVGGLIMGTGIETSSHLYGLFQHTCTSYEIVTADGSVVKCSRDENQDLFYSIPWSHGTLGFLVAAEIQIVRAKNFVKLSYIPCYSIKEMETVFTREIKDATNEFVEGIVYSLDTGIVMKGQFADAPEDTSRDVIPFGNHPVFRYLLGWAVPPKVSFLKATTPKVLMKLYENNHMIQDMLVPLSSFQKTLKAFDAETKLYPLWLCPFILPPSPGLVHPKGAEDELYFDLGAYGNPSTADYDALTTTRKLEKFVRSVKGFQMMYADTYMTRYEFEQMFDHSLYWKVREKYKCDKAFPMIYDKLNRSVRE